MIRRMKLAFTQITWLIVVACAAFVVVMSVSESELAIRMGNYMSLSLSIACLVRYRFEAWRALTRFRPTGINVLGLGIFLNWISSQLRAMSSTLLRDFDIWWLNDTILVPLLLFVVLLSGIFHFAGPKIENGRLPKQSFAQLALIFLFGIIPALLITLFVQTK